MSVLTFWMLWQFQGDDTKQAILEAAQYYEKKYGQKPDICGVNIDADVPKSVRGIRVIHGIDVSSNNVRIGVEEIETETML